MIILGVLERFCIIGYLKIWIKCLFIWIIKFVNLFLFMILLVVRIYKIIVNKFDCNILYLCL